MGRVILRIPHKMRAEPEHSQRKSDLPLCLMRGFAGISAGITLALALALALGIVVSATTSFAASDVASEAGATSGSATALEISNFFKPVLLGASATLSEIEGCATRNLPQAAGVIEFSVEAIGQSGVATRSRAEIRWTKDDDELVRVLLRVLEPAKTAGTALLIMDRKSDQPAFFLRLPEISRVKRVRSKHLRGPVLGTDFSFEDLQRMRDPLDRANLELVGIAEVDGRSAWLLEAIPGPEDGSEYVRVLTYIDQQHCVPIQVDLFERGDRLRKRLRAPQAEIRTVGTAHLPYLFVMEDLRRETRTIIRIEQFASTAKLPVEQFTKRALAEPMPASVAH
ncbi:MAG TPA: outer membrane lipoprotein-sorting protein [Myxococcales bacterium]|nr:outer membrane lipoprotein-sorting protein [Myxococcales bacterium]